MHLSIQSVCNKEHKGIICDMPYKVPYITAKMIYYIPINNTTFELSVFWLSDTESRIKKTEVF